MRLHQSVRICFENNAASVILIPFKTVEP